ncbi:hypothetical protein ACOI1C_16350 [Bacillus sp. DJP31]|uniref:hypothetical protein n=1 Tax=Bacillus sp. DJP31 TaxID=3409789 RepID=UPI003BB7A984
MPDWSYHTIFKPILQKLPPKFAREFIHRGMNTISSLPGGSAFITFLGHMETSKELSRDLFNIDFPSPVGLSGKIDPHLSGIKAFQHLGFGFIEVGPITVNGQIEQDLSVNPEAETITISPITSISVQEAKNKLLSLKKKKVPLLLKLDGAFEDIISLATELSDYADVFVIKHSSLHGASNLRHFKSSLGGKSIILSIPAKELCELLSFDILDRNEIDGIMIDEEQFFETKEQHSHISEGIKRIKAIKGHGFPIVTVGGIKEPVDAIALLQLGASLVLLTFDYVFSGPGLPKRMNEAYKSKISHEEVIIDGWVWYWLFGAMYYPRRFSCPSI